MSLIFCEHGAEVNVIKVVPTIGVVILIFTFMYYLQMLIPTYSDDYFYFLMGNDYLGRAVSHYMTWSGRIVADTISSNMLANLPKFLYSALNSAALVLLVYLVSSLPSKLSKESDPLLPIVMVLIWALYFIANPSFVETSMWIVGSSNYLWTSLAILVYFSLSIKALSSNNLKCSALILISSFVAGCTNESTGVFVPIFSIFLVAFYVPKGKRIFNSINIGVIGGLFGWLVLILSPGNTARALNFTDWYKNPWLNRIGSYVYNQLPVALSELWPLLLTMVYLSIVAIAAGRHSHSKWGIFFFISAMGSALAMAASPYVPSRSYNGALVFLLISLSFTLHSTVSIWGSPVVRIAYLSPAILFCAVFVLPQITMLKSDLELVHQQEKIRNDILNGAKSNDIKYVKVPEFITNPYIGKLTQGFPSNYAYMAKYWGFAEISPFSVGFNYAHIKINDKELVVNASLSDSVKLEKIIFYDELLPFYMERKGMAIYQFNTDPSKLTTDDNVLFLHYITANGEHMNADLGVVTAVKLGNHWYTERHISPEITPDTISSISLGLFDKVKLSRVSSITLDLE